MPFLRPAPFLAALAFLVLQTPARAGESKMLPPDSGYGSWGPCTMLKDSLKHPGWKGNHVYLFAPAGIERPPLFIFCHGIHAADPRAYLALLSFCTSNGYAVLYSPYASPGAYTRPLEAYRQMWEGITAAVDTWRESIDTTRVGFIGHSYGGGAVPALAYKGLVERKWGSRGAFLFIMAPWYCYDMTDEKLEAFGQDVKLIAQVYEDDNVNDHRMAKNVFETISIPSSEKDFVILYSDTLDDIVMTADHGVPTGTLKFGPRVDMLDYYGVHRLVHALADYSFSGSPDAKLVALGNGGPEQRFMGMYSEQDSVRPLYAGDAPALVHAQTYYTNFWSHRMNPRAVMGRDSARIDHNLTIRNYMRSPWYKKMVEEETRDTPQQAQDTMDDDDRECFVAQPATGYGSDGPYEPVENFFPHPGKGDANVHVIVPHGLDTLVPVVLFAPALWKPSPTFYRGLVDHIVSRGNIVIFSTYNYSRFLNQRLRYRVLLEGFEAGVEIVADRIDTTRIAVVGHSYGGGTVPAVGWEYLVNKGWGKKGAALYIMSPWYMRNTTREMLEKFPPHAKLIVETFEGNRKMDWRIAEDIFYSMGIHPNEKDYVFIRDAVSENCEIDADHDAPQSEDADETNVIDYYGIYRLLDALMDYSFTGSVEAKRVGLGNGSKEQVFMGRWHNGLPVEAMLVTDRPSCPHSQRSFVFKWKDRMNPRRRYHFDE